MRLNESAALLGAAPLALETGYERFDDGVLHVACRTDLHGCSGEMFAWWFRSRPDTQKYIWWHPVDHVFSAWLGGDVTTHVGSVHLVEEFFTGLPSQKLAIQFRDPKEFFDGQALDEAYRDLRVTAAICARIGPTHAPPRSPAGEILGGRLMHIARDTPWGCALRSHFYLGQDMPALGAGASEVEAVFSDDFGRALLQHCYNEFTFLSRFLPSLYIAENRDKIRVDVPW